LSLKTDIEMVREELTSEEKFFEKAVVTERFVKKYKNLMIGGVVAVVLFVSGNIAYSVNKRNTIDSANATLIQLQKDASNPATIAKLESLSPALSDVWTYSQALATKDMTALEKLKNSKTTLVGDLAFYEVVQNSNNLEALSAYEAKENAIYADLARMQSAILLMNENKIDEAHNKLSMINLNSPLAQTASALMHYGVK
jgi:hypothetical protein